MAYYEKHRLTPVTDADGDVTVFTPVVNGRIISIIYTKVNYAAGVDVAVTGEDSGQVIWTGTDENSSVTVSPRQPTHSTVGVASLYDTTDNEPVEDYIVVANERIQLVIDEGGITKSGTFDIIIGG